MTDKLSPFYIHFFLFALSGPLADAHFSLQSYCPGEWSSTAMLTGRGLNDSFPQIKDLGISLTPLSVSLPYRPHSAVFWCTKNLFPASGAERLQKEGRKKRLCERRGNIFTMLSVSFFNEVKNKLNIQTLNDMRTRRLSKEQGKQGNISRFPNFHKSGSIKGMKRIYYGMDALLVRCGDYIYK